MSKIHFLIAAASSGSGKTTFTMGMLRALRNRNLKVQPFKCGPDYIDTQYHTLAAGTQSVNLDTWMASPVHVRDLFTRYGNDADACVVEGVMGLFDGSRKSEGSSADIAKHLDLPVILLVNAKSTAYSVAPLIFGFKNFDKSVNIAGVIFNQVSSESHFSFLKDACDDAGVECLGYLPKLSGMEIPSRHLGLSLEHLAEQEKLINRVAEEIERHVDMDKLFELTAATVHSHEYSAGSEAAENKLRIAVARDNAFNFTYRENIRKLSEKGEIIYFSPIADSKLPDNIDFLYLPGGYPEFYLEELSSNKTMLCSIADYIENGGKAFAECGGMMYLCKSIIGMDGKQYPVVGVLDNVATMESMKLHLGYRKFIYKDREIRGHEFHYSSVKEENLESVVNQYSARNTLCPTPVYRYKNLIAGYTHWYWGEFDLLELIP